MAFMTPQQVVATLNMSHGPIDTFANKVQIETAKEAFLEAAAILVEGLEEASDVGAAAAVILAVRRMRIDMRARGVRNALCDEALFLLTGVPRNSQERKRQLRQEEKDPGGHLISK